MQQAQTASLQQTFNSFDKEKQGSIEMDQFAKLMQALGQQLSEDQLNQITSRLQTKEYGRITYKQFQFWWKDGYKGALGELVYLKQELKKSGQKMLAKLAQQSNFNLMDLQKTQKINNLNVQFNFIGEQRQGLNIKAQVHVGGKQGIQKSNQLVTKYSLNKDSLNFLIVLTATNEQQVIRQKLHGFLKKLLKNEFIDKLLQKIPRKYRTNIGGDLYKEMNNDYFQIKVQVAGSKIFVLIEFLPFILQILQGPIQIVNNFLSLIKTETVLSANIDFSTNFSFQDFFQKNIVDTISMGANLKIKCQAAEALVFKLREFVQLKTQTQFNRIFLLLLKNLSLKLNLKSPSMIDKFFQKLGIKNILQQIPTLSQLLEQVSMFGAIFDLKVNQQHHLHTLYQFLFLLNQGSVQNYQFYVQYKDYVVSTEFSLPDSLKIFKTVFNEL